MLMRNRMTFPDTDGDSALPGIVAPFPHVSVIKDPDLTLIWRTREQRERE
jgi:hypothetical protein